VDERLAAHAEVGSDDRDAPATIDARRASDADGGDSDLAPLAREQVRSMRRARDPQPHRTSGAQARRSPYEVLACRPVRVAARGVEVSNPLPELHPVGGGMAEITEPAHLERVPERRSVESRRLTQRREAVRGAKPVQRGEHLAVQRLEAGLRPA